MSFEVRDHLVQALFFFDIESVALGFFVVPVVHHDHQSLSTAGGI